MTYILTYIVSKNGAPLTQNQAQAAAALTGGDWSWLKEGKAFDIAVSNKPTRAQLTAYRAAVDPDQVDILMTKADTRRKKLLIADMDSTIVTGETLDDLAAFAGIKAQISAITARAMNGELNFHDAIRERVGLLKGLRVTALQGTLDELKYNDGAGELVRSMRENGAKCVLISGGFTFFTQAVYEALSFDAHHGNTLGLDGDVLSGLVIDPILDKDSKLSFLKAYIDELGITAEESVTVGDGANDLPMLQHAGLGVGYYAKPHVAAQVDNIIKHGDLTALLYAQGIVYQP